MAMDMERNSYFGSTGLGSHDGNFLVARLDESFASFSIWFKISIHIKIYLDH
jgi:hypothetical protein